LITELAAVDTELGVLKTGKEADVHLVRRALPGTDRECLLAEALPRGRAPAVPPGRRLPGGPPDAPQPGEPRDGHPHVVRS
jgi:hypothetical protein